MRQACHSPGSGTQFARLTVTLSSSTSGVTKYTNSVQMQGSSAQLVGPGMAPVNTDRRVRSLPSPPDTIGVLEIGRVVLFTSEGTFLTTWSVPLATTARRFSDGAFLVLSVANPATLRLLGAVTDSVALIRVTPGTHMADTLLIVPGHSQYRMQTSEGIDAYPAPFAPTVHAAPAGDELYVGDGSKAEAILLDRLGKVVRITRFQDVDRTVSSEMTSALENEMLETAQAEEQRIRYSALFREWQYPKEYPAFDRMLVNALGFLWLRAYVKPGDPDALWNVFDGAGTWIARVATPTRLRVTEIGEDYVLGIARDEYDTEVVQLFDLTR